MVSLYPLHRDHAALEAHLIANEQRIVKECASEWLCAGLLDMVDVESVHVARMRKNDNVLRHTPNPKPSGGGFYPSQMVTNAYCIAVIRNSHSLDGFGHDFGHGPASYAEYCLMCADLTPDVAPLSWNEYLAAVPKTKSAQHVYSVVKRIVNELLEQQQHSAAPLVLSA